MYHRSSSVAIQDEEEADPAAIFEDDVAITETASTSTKLDFFQLSIILVGLICMGAALGFERSLLPRMAVAVFGVTSSTTVLQLVASFGVAKAVANVIAGPLADKFGRRPTLILGFIIGLPVMPYVNVAHEWSGITSMNICFGLSQGLLGSALFFLLIDVMGPQRRGIAVGLGECTIYVTTAMVNVLAGDLASRFGYRPVPFWVATLFAVMGLASSGPLKDTLDQVRAEQDLQQKQMPPPPPPSVADGKQIGDLHKKATPAKFYAMSPATCTTSNSTIATNQDLRNHPQPDRKCTVLSSAMEEEDPGSYQKESSTSSQQRKNDLPILHTGQKQVQHQQQVLPTTHPSATTTPWYEEQEFYHYSMDSDLESSSTSDIDGDEIGRETTKHSQNAAVYFDARILESERVPQSGAPTPAQAAKTPGVEWDNESHFTAQSRQSAHQLHMELCGEVRASAIETNNNDEDDEIIMDAIPTELTPLFSIKDDPWHETYEAETDSELDPGSVVDWDEVEHEVKTLYPSALPILWQILRHNQNFNLLCISGMTINVKDGFAWGSFPIFFSQFLNDDHTNMLVAVYPLCWGFAQAFTGALSDIYGRKLFLLSGFGTCTFAATLYVVPEFLFGKPDYDDPLCIRIWLFADVLLGLGTAMAYPALQAAAADEIEPVNRGLGLGFYRFTRDMGFFVGAVMCGSLTDMVGYSATFLLVSALLGACFLCLLFLYTTKTPHC